MLTRFSSISAKISHIYEKRVVEEEEEQEVYGQGSRKYVVNVFRDMIR